MDESLLAWINQGWGNAWLDPFMTGLSAKGAFGIPLLLGLAGWLAWRHGRRGRWLALGLLITVGLGDLGGQFLKNHLQHPRPCAETGLTLRAPPGQSPHCTGDLSGMPSNHALNFFAATGFLAFSLRRRGLTIVLAIIATLVGLSRIYLGVHYPSQVLAGAILGLLVGLAAGALWRSLLDRVLPSE